ncbi:MAG: TolC family protein [Phycisphaeraceae bacterium]|nr:TolC family protein [Phycisphaeraceae bacterium]
MTPRFSVIAFLVGALTLVGCAVPDIDGSFGSVGDLTRERIGAEVAWPVTPEAATAIDERVAVLLAEPLDAERVVAIALLNNRRLRARYATLGMAQADFIESGLLDNPMLSAGVAFPDRPPSKTELDFGLTLNLLRVLVTPARREIASLGVTATTLLVASDVLDTATEARRAFLDLQAATHTSEMLGEIARAAEASAEFARRVHAAGNLSDLALANQEALWEQTRVTHARSLAEVLDRRERLNVHLGLWGERTGWTIVGRLPELPRAEPDLADLESLAVRQRLDLAAAAAEVQAIAKAAGLQRDWRYLLTTEVGAIASRGSDGQWVYGPEIALELPVFDQRQGQIVRLDAELLASESRLEALAIEVRSEVRRLRDRLYAIRHEVQHYRDVLIPQRERITRLTQEQYNFMLADTFDLLAAKREEFASYREYLERIHEYWSTRAELERAVGGRLPMPEPSPRESPPAEIPVNHHDHGDH